MKTKMLATAIVLLSAYSLNAQNSSAILKAGLNVANVTITNDGDIEEANSLTSFQVGIIGDFNLAPFLSLQPGLLFTGKGSKTISGNPSGSTYRRATSNPYYVEVPLNLVFKTPTGSMKFFAGAGPYVAIGVAGKNKVDGKILGTSFGGEQKIEWSNDDPFTTDYEEGAGYGIMKRFDYGLNALAGIETKKAVLSAGYGFGLAKIQSGTNAQQADDRNKHRVFSFTVGVKL